MNSKQNIIKEKIEKLNKANKAYEEGEEIISNFEYDKLYDELVALEKETGIVFSTSPTQRVGYELVSALPKEKHAHRMLSLDKTKEEEALVQWLGDNTGLLSWKLDGLTVVLTYQGGQLVKGVTRGNGEIGEVITQSTKTFTNIPLSIPFQGKVVVRGEAIITYSNFEKINSTIEDVESKYKNPRNLCSGTVRQLNPKITKERGVEFHAFGLIEAEGISLTYRHEEKAWLKENGFVTVESIEVSKENLLESLQVFHSKIEKYDIPSDGLVLTLDNIKYANSLGSTSKFPRDSIAFKWSDQIAVTTLKEIIWSPSRTGLINPIASFEPVELEGTTVSRASVHNVSLVKELELGTGDQIEVYKANMIIPQIYQNLTKSNNISIPDKCNICGHPTNINNNNGVETLVCPNEKCEAKHIKSFSHFVSRNAMNMEGIFESTLIKFMEKGIVKSLGDIFDIPNHREVITTMEGFGEKSFNNLVASINNARQTTPARLLYAFGVPNIGVANAKVIAKAANNSWKKIVSFSMEELEEIEGIGQVMAKAFVAYFEDQHNKEVVENILSHIALDESCEETSNAFDGVTFVITGGLTHYENRDTLKSEIENMGGKVASAISAKTNYLINNDVLSTSGKNKKAKELNITIINEEKIKTWLELGEIVNE